MRFTNRLILPAAACAVLVLGLSLTATSAQSTTSAERQGMIATVDVVTLLEEMLQTPEYLTPRDDLRESIQSELAKGENQLINLETQIRAMDPADPARNEQILTFQNLQQQLEIVTRTKAAEYDQSGARQAVVIYNRVSAAAGAVGVRMGYDYIVASRSSDASMGGEGGLTAVTQQILARPMLFGAENDDITSTVRAELGLPDPDAAADAGDDADG